MASSGYFQLPLLDKRLRAVADLVRKGTVLADIGADHAYLICHLMSEGTIRSGYACEINEKPLENAKKTIEKCGFSEKIEAVLSDGLSALENREFDEVVIAGMGGELICDLLSRSPWCRKKELHFILQPMTRAEVLRRYLCENGFELEKETAAAAAGFCYTVFSVYYTGEKKPCTELFAHFGKLPENEDEQSLQYLCWQKKRIGDKLAGLKKAKETAEEAKKTQKLLDEMKAVLNEKRKKSPKGDEIQGGSIMNPVMENLLTRRSVRSFLEKPIPKEELDQILKAAVYAPSARNLQTWKFTAITNRKTIQELAAVVGRALGNDQYNFYQPEVLILPSNDRNAMFGREDNACALENIFLAAHSFGIGSVWVNQFTGICDQPEVRAFLRKLQIPDQHVIYGVAALGYPAPGAVREVPKTGEAVIFD